MFQEINFTVQQIWILAWWIRRQNIAGLYQQAFYFCSADMYFFLTMFCFLLNWLTNSNYFKNRCMAKWFHATEWFTFIEYSMKNFIKKTSIFWQISHDQRLFFLPNFPALSLFQKLELATLWLWYIQFLPGWSGLEKSWLYIACCSTQKTHKPVHQSK